MSDIDKLEKRLSEWAYRVSIGDLMPDTLVRGAVELITADRKRVALEARIDTLEYAKISPKFKIEEKIEQLRLEMKKYDQSI